VFSLQCYSEIKMCKINNVNVDIDIGININISISSTRSDRIVVCGG